MTTDANESKCNIILPPGNILNTDISINHAGKINFPNNPEQPLLPHVESKIKDGVITVRTLVFINSSAENPELKISQLFSINNSGKCQLQFFIHCDTEEIDRLMDEKTEDSYIAYSVEFTTQDTNGFPYGIYLKDIEITQTFLWNIDPKTSRGTETVVQTTDD